MKPLTSKVLASDPEAEWLQRNVQMKPILVGIAASKADCNRRGESEAVLIHYFELNAMDRILAIQRYFDERRLSKIRRVLNREIARAFMSVLQFLEVNAEDRYRAGSGLGHDRAQRRHLRITDRAHASSEPK